MKKWILALSLVSSVFAAEEIQETPTKETCFHERLPNDLLVIDPHYSPYMGAEDIYTGFDLLSQLEDKWLPITRSEERRMLPCLVRLADQMLWDTFGGYMSIWQHEFFGHGYRIRSFDSSKIQVTGYSNDLYSGYTEFEYYPDQLTLSESNVIALAGLEAEDIMTRTIARKWVENNEIDSRLAGLYIQSALSSWGYALVSDDDDVPNKTNYQTDSNDITGYVFGINELYPKANLTVRDIEGHLSCNLLDPMIYYSVYAEIKYILFGEKCSVPMFKFNVGDTCLKFLPAFRVRLTPYGLENDMVGYFKVGNNPITVDVRWGELAQFTFGGVHINAPYLIQWGQSSSFGLEIDTWKQPNFEASPTLEAFNAGVDMPRPSRNRYGGALLANTDVALNKKGVLHGYVKLGYKSKGYYPGYILKAGLIGRVGIAGKF